jgi:hypothetical protein
MRKKLRPKRGLLPLYSCKRDTKTAALRKSMSMVGCENPGLGASSRLISPEWPIGADGHPETRKKEAVRLACSKRRGLNRVYEVFDSLTIPTPTAVLLP